MEARALYVVPAPETSPALTSGEGCAVITPTGVCGDVDAPLVQLFADGSYRRLCLEHGLYLASSAPRSGVRVAEGR